MAQPIDLTTRQIEAIAYEVVQNAALYMQLYGVIQVQLRKRGILFADAGDGRWAVIRKKPTYQSKQFGNMADALAYAFELYEVKHE